VGYLSGGTARSILQADCVSMTLKRRRRLFRKYEPQTEQYAVTGLEWIGL